VNLNAVLGRRSSSPSLSPSSASSAAQQELGPVRPQAPVAVFVNASCVSIAWGGIAVNEDGERQQQRRVGQEAESYHVEMSYGTHNDSFAKLAVVGRDAPRLVTVGNLPPLTFLRFRVRAYSRTSFSFFSAALTVATSEPPRNEWTRLWPRRVSEAFRGYGKAAPVVGRPHVSTGTQDPQSRSYDPVGPRDDHTRVADGPSEATAGLAPSPRRGHTLTTLFGHVYLFRGLTQGYDCSAAVTDTFRFGHTSAGLAADPCRYLPGESDELWRYEPLTNLWRHLLPGQGRWLGNKAESVNANGGGGSSSDDASLLGSFRKPPPREQHTASVVDNKVLVFGGVASSGDDTWPHQDSIHQPVGSELNPEFKNDLWELDAGELSYSFTAHAPSFSTLLGNGSSTNTTSRSQQPRHSIPEGGHVFVPLQVNETKELLRSSNSGGSSSTARDLCIVDLDVTVSLAHPCTRQVELVLFGPGPNAHDANYLKPSSRAHSVLLFDHHDGTGSGCGRDLKGTTFDDDAPESVASCCPSPFEGRFKPVEKLSTFQGLRPGGEWLLGAYDHDADGLKGSVEGWSVTFTLKECDQTFHWRQLNATGVPSSSSSALLVPSPRAQHAAIVVGNSVFVFGGRGESKAAGGSKRSVVILRDLWRLDRFPVPTWHLLSEGDPSNGSGRHSASIRGGVLMSMSQLGSLESSGRSTVLSPWGLLAFGGLKDANLVANPAGRGGAGGGGGGFADERLEERVWRLDLWSEEWEVVAHKDEHFGNARLSAQTKAGPAAPHYHRSGGAGGAAFPGLSESTPSVGRYLVGVAIVGEGAARGGGREEADKGRDEGYGTKHKGWPAVYTFGGDDSARTVHDDLRRLELHGLAAEPFLHRAPNIGAVADGVSGGVSGGVGFGGGMSGAGGGSRSSVFKAHSVEALRRDRCDWRLKKNTTANNAWLASCLANTTTTATASLVAAEECSLIQVLQRAWCEQEFQSTGFL